jgi:hypothetical protein
MLRWAQWSEVRTQQSAVSSRDFLHLIELFQVCEKQNGQFYVIESVDVVTLSNFGAFITLKTTLIFNLQFGNLQSNHN